MANSKQHYLNENKEIIINLLSDNTPLSEIARNLQIKYDTLKRFLDNNRIPYNTNPHRKGKPHFEARKSAEYYMTNDVSITAPKLRKKLIEEGFKNGKCECCGMTEWLGKPIPLELHHINGNHYDNRLENLQLLCRNCHGLAHNYGEIQKKTTKPKKLIKNVNNNEQTKQYGNCDVCGKPLKTYRRKYCSQECAHKAQKRIDYTKELIMETLLKYKSYVQAGKALGISDKSFKKWCDKYNIKMGVDA